MTADAPKVMYLVWLGDYEDDETVIDNQTHTVVSDPQIAIDIAKQIANECERPCHVYKCELTLHGTAVQAPATYSEEGL